MRVVIVFKNGEKRRIDDIKVLADIEKFIPRFTGYSMSFVRTIHFE